MIDHLVYACSDLLRASERISSVLGVAPTPGGSHVGRGTRNELVSLGDRAYLEVIGPDAEQPKPVGARPFGVDDRNEPALVAWCVRPDRPLDEIVTTARRAGVHLGEVAAMSRRRPDGVLLEWQLTPAQLDGPFGCALPFLIDWGTSVHPTQTLAPGLVLLGLTVAHPRPDELRAALELIGADAHVEICDGSAPALSATIATPTGEFTLTS